MDSYERFDKYFIYSYYDEDGKKIGVFKEGTPESVTKEVEFDVIEFE